MVFGKNGVNKAPSVASTGKSKAERCIAYRATKRTKQSYPSEIVESASLLLSESNQSRSTTNQTKAEAIAAGRRWITEEEKRVYTVVSYYLRFHEPVEEDWAPNVATVAYETGMNTRTVNAVFLRCLSGEERAQERKAGSGRPLKLEKDNPGLVAAAFALNSGQSPTMAAILCNTHNKSIGIDITICRNTLLSTIRNYTDIECSATLRRKTGKKDANSDWAVARLAFAEQLIHQRELAKKVDSGQLKLHQCELPPLYDDGVLWVDQNHMKQVIGGSGHRSSFGNRQYRIATDDSGNLLPLSHGGRKPKRKFRVVPKYPEEARGAYGVATPTINNKQCGKMMLPFDYTSRKLVSIKVAENEEKIEIERRKKATAGDWVRYRDHENPYKARYGNDWKRMIYEAKGSKCRKIRSVFHMIQHIIAQGNIIFAETRHSEDYLIYHDHLKIFWEKETIKHLQTLKCPTSEKPDRTWYDRFIKLKGKYNEKVSNRYKNTLPGDSPELMPLDCHLFADTREGLARNIALSFWMEKNDERKYDASTPNNLFKSICRTLRSCPSEARIVEDCTRIFTSTIFRIRESSGTYIEDSRCSSRNGVRAVAAKHAMEEAPEGEIDRRLKADPTLETAFFSMIEKVRKNEITLPLIFDDQATPNFITVPIEDDEEDNDNNT